MWPIWSRYRLIFSPIGIMIFSRSVFSGLVFSRLVIGTLISSSENENIIYLKLFQKLRHVFYRFRKKSYKLAQECNTRIQVICILLFINEHVKAVNVDGVNINNNRRQSVKAQSGCSNQWRWMLFSISNLQFFQNIYLSWTNRLRIVELYK